jgi:hypothetical protein
VDEVESVFVRDASPACNKWRRVRGDGGQGAARSNKAKRSASGWSIWPPAFICTGRMTSLARDVTAVV